ncbi:MAG: thioredoxin family protein [Kangiellaceae bacterium]|jgi:hypothetical protein|nr:thioredoxin family protein [Kangiellaceae bacterium]
MSNKINFLTVISVLIYSSLSFASDAESEQPKPYKVIENPEQHIAQEFELAEQQNKQVLFVLGGNWCHDSQSLAQKLSDQSLTKTLKQSYRVSMIDVGYYQYGYEFTRLANMQAFYATPTVLIFDPKSRKHLNADDMHQWGNAYRIAQDDTTKYFKDYAQPVADSIDIAKFSDQQVVKLTELEAFRAQQEQRIVSGYQVVGPMLKAYEEKSAPEEFDQYWGELRGLRSTLPKDLAKLKQQIIDKPDAPLVFPDYPRFTWESK